MNRVIIHTDGGASPNPGRGGYGAVLQAGDHRKELSGGFAHTTNNRMELMAAIVALEALKRPCQVQLHSDSQYVVKAFTQGWVHNWARKGWQRDKKPVPNADLWQRLLRAVGSHTVEWCWVKGHAGVLENERCDQLAQRALQQPDLPADEGYTDADPDV